MNNSFLLRWILTGLASALLLLPARAQTPPAEWATACAGGPPFYYSSSAPPVYGFGPTRLATDTQNNTYVAGQFTGSITLGTTSLSATQTTPGYGMAYDTYLAKLNAQGQYQWAIQLGDGQGIVVSQVVADSFGNVYLTGSFGSYSAQLGMNGPVLYNSSNDSEGFVARFSSQNGQCQWARRFGGTGFDSGNILSVSSAGEVYLAGITGDGVADFGPYTLPAAPAYGYRSFMAKLSAVGTWLWVQRLSGTNNVSISSLLPDEQGSFYLLGGFSGPSLTLGNTTLTVNTVSGGSGGSDVLIAKYSESGVLRWARQANPGGYTGQGISQGVYDGQGHLFVVGSFTSRFGQFGSFVLPNAGPLVPDPTPAPPTPNVDRYFADAFVARYDTAGTWQWATRQGATTEDRATAVVLDGAARPWVRYLSATTLTQLYPVDAASGTWGSPYTLPAPGFNIFALARDPLGRLYVAGSFTGPGLTLGSVTVPATGGSTFSSGYVARLGQLPLAAQPAAAPGPGLHAWPSPGPGTGVSVEGVPAGQLVEVFDVLGRRVGAGLMPASGPLRLAWPGAGLAAGVYVLRSSAQIGRWVVEN